MLLLATPNTLVLDSRYPRERDWPDVRVVTFRRMIYSDYWYEKRLKSTLYMVGGPGTTFDTSTAVGTADAVTRILQAYAAQNGYAKTASREVPALRAHLLRTSQATRQACSSSDGPCSNDHQLRSAAGGCEEPRSSAMVNVYDQLRQT